MRWRLVLIASFLAALSGTGASLSAIHWWFGSHARLAATLFASSGAAAAGALVVPAAAITFASIFVYRHTSRRRPLQALVTALLAVLLTLAAFVTAATLLPSGAAQTARQQSYRNSEPFPA